MREEEGRGVEIFVKFKKRGRGGQHKRGGRNFKISANIGNQ